MVAFVGLKIEELETYELPHGSKSRSKRRVIEAGEDAGGEILSQLDSVRKRVGISRREASIE
jgi:hypothetical protein